MPLLASEHPPLFEWFESVSIFRASCKAHLLLEKFSRENGNKTSLMTFLPLGNHVAQMEKIKLQSVELISSVAFLDCDLYNLSLYICD